MNVEKSFPASIVRLFATDEEDVRVVGTGFLVGTKYILTCAHVVAQALDIAEETNDFSSHQTVSLDFPKSSVQKRFTAHSVCWYPSQMLHDLSVVSVKDIAVLELDEMAPADALATHFALSKKGGRSGHRFFTYGFPRGYNQSISATGELRAVELNGWMQLEVTPTTGIPIEPGFSGAPVWDKDDGGVVGMIVEVEKREGIRVAFAIPTEILIEAWPALDDYINNDLSPIAEELEEYFQRLHENLSWLPEYYPHGFSFDHIRQRIQMKQQTSTEDEMYEHENTGLAEGSTTEDKTSSKGEEQAYKTRTDDITQGGSAVADWDTIRAEGVRAALPSRASEKAKTQTDTIIVDWETIRSEVKRVVLLGDPGSGKSWLLKYEGRVIARQQLEKLRRGQLRQEDVILPIFLRLGSFAEEIGAGHSNIIELIVSVLKQEYELSEAFLLYVRRWITGAQCLLLLDALDEVAEDRRTRMREALRHLSENSECRILLTSRIIGYRGAPFARKGGKWRQELELVAFAQEQIESFVGSWFVDRTEYGQHLLDTLHAEPPLRLLAGIPLLLSFLCLATALCDTIPTRRAELYETVMHLLLEASWRNERPEGPLASRVEKKQALLECVAWHFARLGGRWHDLMVAEELEKAAEQWAQTSSETTLAQDILKELIEKDAILVKIGASQRRKQKEKIPYLFLHRTFHEYLVARYLANLPIDECLQLVQPHFWFDTDWEVVIMLLAGCLDDPNPLLVAILKEPHDVFHSMLLLAGRCLVEANKLLVKPDIKETIIERLFALLYSPAGRDRAQVIPIVAKMGEVVVDKLLSILEDRIHESPMYPIDVCVAAAEVLGQINYPRVVSSLANVLQHGQVNSKEDMAVYTAVAKALGRISNAQSAQVLISAFTPNMSGARSSALLNAIGQMNKSLAVEMLKTPILQENTNMAIIIINKLSTIDNTQAIEVLMKVLHDNYKAYESLLSLRRYIARHLSLVNEPGRMDLLMALLKEEATIDRALRHAEDPAIDAWLKIIQQIDTRKGNAHQCWKMAWSIDQPDEEIVGTFLEVVWNNPERYQLLLSVQEIAAWALGQTNDPLERESRVSELKALSEMYSEEYMDTIITRSMAYQNKSAAEGLMEALKGITDGELDRYIDCVQYWMLASIQAELIKTKLAEKSAALLTSNVVSALGGIGGRKISSVLVNMLHLENKEPRNDTFRRNLVNALRRTGDSQTRKVFLEVLHDCIQNPEWISYQWAIFFDEKNIATRWLFQDTIYALVETCSSQAIEPLLTILQKNDNDTVAWKGLVESPIIKALGKIGDPQLIDVLLPNIYHKDYLIRNTSAEALGNISDTRSVNVLLANLFTSPFSKIFSLAVEHLSKKETEGSPLWIGLRIYREWRAMTEDALITMGKQGNPLITHTLLEAAQKRKGRMRRVKRAVFGRSSRKWDLDLLMHTLLDKNEDIKLRKEAADLLGRIGDIRVVEGLLVCLQEQDEGLYSKVVNALERLATTCDPGLFCKRLLHAQARLALNKQAHALIYELLAQQGPHLRDDSGTRWSRWRAHLMPSTNAISSQQHLRIFLSTWERKIMEIYSSLKRVQKDLSTDDQRKKDGVQATDSPASQVNVMETVFALIWLKESTAGWLSYFLGWVTGIMFLMLWRKNNFVRFHAIQSILFFLPVNMLVILLSHFTGSGILLEIVALITLACWILLMAFAREGKYFRLPFLGICAQRLATSASKAH